MTKLASLVLICIVSLAVVAGVGFALSTSVTQRTEATLSKANTKVIVFAAPGYRVKGDPINSPKPNGLETLV